MRRIRTIGFALGALALTAGLAWAHAMPAASDHGLTTARDASGQNVPLAADESNANDSNTDEDSTNEPAAPTDVPPADTHGSTVAAAAQGDTPDGFANHGAYVSSIAKGWGQQTAADHQNAAATGDRPDAAQNGLSHKP
jgi:hypothetical protein